MRYKVLLHQSDEGYSVWVPGLPGCCSQGATEDEALLNIADAIHDYLAVVEELAEGVEHREVEVSV
jgi:predicted RNase H-like HicB family nuclease